MIEAPLPQNEEHRLQTLRSLHLLDTPLEQQYEVITRLVQQRLDVPVAAFTLIDDVRQWFKSIQGSEMKETPRSLAFCAHTILQDDVMLVPDAHADARFANHPMVVDNAVCFYAGCSVRAPNGDKIGALCAVDSQPRHMTDAQMQILRDLAGMVERELRQAVDRQAQADEIIRLHEER